jgi:hypothetical protein
MAAMPSSFLGLSDNHKNDDSYNPMDEFGIDYFGYDIIYEV